MREFHLQRECICSDSIAFRSKLQHVEPHRCGIWGVLAAALFDWGVPRNNWHGWGGFSPTEGATLGSGLAANVTGVVAIMAWSGILLALVRPAVLDCPRTYEIASSFIESWAERSQHL